MRNDSNVGIGKMGESRSMYRRIGWILFCGLALPSCGSTLQQMAQDKADNLHITLTDVVGTASLQRGAGFLLTARIDNRNAIGMTLVASEYCLHVNGEEITCATFPPPGQLVRIDGKSSRQVTTHVTVGPAILARLAAATLRKSGPPVCVLVGNATTSTIYGQHTFRVQTPPIDIDLKRVEIQWKL